MISRNLRHLRVLLAVAERGSVAETAAACHLSQPAVTQAVGKLERLAGGLLFDRTREGVFLTDRGRFLAARVTRALALLDPALDEVSSRMRLTTTTAQLRALIAVSEAQNFTLAAHSLGLAQPTVRLHRWSKRPDASFSSGSGSGLSPAVPAGRWHGLRAYPSPSFIWQIPNWRNLMDVRWGGS